MRKVFICYTPYHIYQAVLKSIELNEKENTIIITDHLKHSNFFFETLKKAEIFHKVIFVPEMQITNSLNNKSLYKKIFKRKALLVDLFSEFGIIERLEKDHIFLFLDTRYLSALAIYVNRGKITLMEDGKFTYLVPKITIKERVKNLVYKLDSPYGRHKEIKEIEVLNPSELPKDIIFKSKKFPLDKITEDLKQEQKDNILSIFINKEQISFDKSQKKMLLITQPLSENNWISEEKKIELYEEILNEHGEGHQVFIKTHPRENTNYSAVFGHKITLLPQEFPLEILTLIKDAEFSKAVTIDSSALYNLKKVKEKVYLGYHYDNELYKNVSTIVDLKK
ncbi:glycosyltransferase family 52 [Bacillus sp. P14.5]|uniref:glycosyltransferase family 52 n=1 Tax=Bacillus sp. P14.5 TaxID=1983400 RepID=UPI000DE95E07|nr:glycosyltransferase family 52 [Bacillus sp. P14.5]